MDNRKPGKRPIGGFVSFNRNDPQKHLVIFKISHSNETYGGENLPSVDSLGELVAFQGPPKLTTLDISSLHIPRHFHYGQSNVIRGE